MPAVADGQVAVVTATPLQIGDKVKPGSVVTEVSGRPVVFLRLAFPLYRDLRTGDRGNDVTALQRGLTDAGLYQGSPDGKYGARTAEAVVKMYRNADVAPPEDPVEAEQPSANDTRPGNIVPSPPAGSVEASTESRPGGWLPRAEILAANVPDLTVVTVARVGTTLGTDTPTAATLRGGEPRVTARVPVAAEKSFEPGTEVRVAATSDVDRGSTGKVTALGPFSAGSDSQAAGYDATISLTDRDARWRDEDRVTVTRAGDGAAAREAVAVPMTALREDSDGAFVSVEQAPGRIVPVRIVVGLQDAGWAEIADGDVQPGQRVVVAGA